MMTITGTKTTSPSGIVKAGEVLTYTIVFSSDEDVSAATITDPIPALTVYKPGTIAGTPAASVTAQVVANTAAWTVSGVAANSPVSLTFAVTVNTPVSDGLLIANTAWLSDTVVMYTNTIASAPALHLQKDVSPSAASVGSAVVYSLHYSNTGTMTATQVIITDTLPNGVRLSASSVPTSGQSGNQAWWLVPDLPPDGTERQLMLTATAGVTGALINRAEMASQEGATATGTSTIMISARQVYLPVIILPELTTLSLQSHNAGTINLTIQTVPVTTCHVDNDTIAQCDHSFLPGTYRVAGTTGCGSLQGTYTYPPGKATMHIYCN